MSSETELKPLTKKKKSEDDKEANKLEVEDDQLDINAKVKGFNVNSTQKTLAQALLDLALLTSNFTQLKHLILIGDLHPFYQILICCVSLSLVLQVILGLLLLFLGLRDIKQHNVRKINNSIAILIFVITILNVFIAIFNDETISRKYRDCLRRITASEKTNETIFNYTERHWKSD